MTTTTTTSDREVYAWDFGDGLECADCHTYYRDMFTHETEEDALHMLARLNAANVIYLDERSHALPDGFTCASCGDVIA